MKQRRYEVDKAESKNSSVDINNCVDFDLDYADQEEANSNKRKYENEILGIYLSGSCFFQAKNAEKSLSE